MAAPDIILQKPFVLILEGSSVLGGNVSGSDIGFGQIVNIYETSDSYAIGDYVMYNGVEKYSITYDSVEYFLVKESFIYYKEIPVP